MESITNRLDRSRNDWSKCLYYLILDYTDGTNMKKVLGHSPLFWKWQTRLSDLCKYHQELREKLNKTPVPFKDPATGKEGYYTHYVYIGSHSYLINLYNKINKLGLYRAHKPKTETKS